MRFIVLALVVLLSQVGIAQCQDDSYEVNGARYNGDDLATPPSVNPYQTYQDQTNQANGQLYRYRQGVAAKDAEERQIRAEAKAKSDAEKEAKRRNQGLFMRSLADQAKYPSININDNEAELDTASATSGHSTHHKRCHKNRRVNVNVNVRA